MATTSHYLPSLLPWQTLSPVESIQHWSLELISWPSDPAIVTLYLRQSGRGRWHWSIFPDDFNVEPLRGPNFGYANLATCEAGMLRALAGMLHAPSPSLPPQEGVTTLRKEVGKC